MPISENTSLGVLTVATNIYINYWEEMVLSLDRNLNSEQHCVAHVFTEQVERAEAFAKKLTKVSVQVHQIPAYGWPDATIKRYEIFSEFSEKITQDVVIHLDADMLILENVFEEIILLAHQKGVSLVAHPGFWNRKFTLRTIIRAWLSRSNSIKGSWETRSKSQAFVKPKARTSYVCGGIWFGKRNQIFQLIKQLSLSVEMDRQNSIMAVWHDESHLNNWASRNEFLLLTPEFCYVYEYEHLKALKPKILAVTKKVQTR